MNNTDKRQHVDSVTYDVRNGVAWIGFNRPQSRNAMTWEMYDALEKYCDQLAENDAVYAVVLHGIGGEAFVAGTDISQFAGFTQPNDAIDYERRTNRCSVNCSTSYRNSTSTLC